MCQVVFGGFRAEKFLLRDERKRRLAGFRTMMGKRQYTTLAELKKAKQRKAWPAMGMALSYRVDQDLDQKCRIGWFRDRGSRYDFPSVLFPRISPHPRHGRLCSSLHSASAICPVLNSSQHIRLKSVLPDVIADSAIRGQPSHYRNLNTWAPDRLPPTRRRSTWLFQSNNSLSRQVGGTISGPA